jgi:hypothetical protein
MLLDAGNAASIPLVIDPPAGGAEPRSAWTRPHSRVPLLVLAGSADPQDPIGNLPGLRRSFPESRVVTAPYQGHGVGQYGCLGRLVGEFVARGTARGLDARCARDIPPPSFDLGR